MVSRDLYLLSKSEKFHLDSGQEASINLKLKTAPPFPCTKLRGKVISGCRKIPGATVKILSMSFKPICHTETGDDGNFSFINALIPGNYQVIVSADDYLLSESRFISLMPFVPSYMTIKLSPDKDAENAAVYGTVRNSENIPLPGIRVCIFSKENGKRPINFTMTNTDGEYLFTGIKAGKYVISASRYGYTLPERITVEIFPKDIFCADIYLYRNTLQEKGTVSGVAFYDGHKVPYAATALYRKESDGYGLIQVKQANRNGEYLFTGLKAGEYLVKAKL